MSIFVILSAMNINLSGVFLYFIIFTSDRDMNGRYYQQQTMCIKEQNRIEYLTRETSTHGDNESSVAAYSYTYKY